MVELEIGKKYKAKFSYAGHDYDFVIKIEDVVQKEGETKYKFCFISCKKRGLFYGDHFSHGNPLHKNLTEVRDDIGHPITAIFK
jgi:hypothetical protein